MALNRQDCLELARQIERLLREFDPGSFELVMGSAERSNDPRRHVVEPLRTIRRMYAERSGGTHGPMLDPIIKASISR